MDDTTPHPLETPIDWDKSMLAKHDAVYRQATLIGNRNLPSMKSDHRQGLVFENWTDGNPPATASGSTKSADHMCGVEGCGKAFIRKGDLTRHLKSHQGGPRTYPCLAEECPRKGLKDFWREDKFKDHMERKHPEIEYERWYYTPSPGGGYRDVEKREQHEALMRSKGFQPFTFKATHYFREMPPSEMEAEQLMSLSNDAS
ncbi:MAG: hypothetical protein Q9221_007333 [Calogaya cf. arnoldii]